MEREPMSEGDLADAKRMLTQPLDGVSHEGWQLVKARLGGAMRQIGDVGRAVEQELTIQQLLSTSVLPLAALPSGGYTKANTSLVYDPSQRLGLDERFDRLVALLANVGLKRADLDLGSASEEDELPGWPMMLTVNPVDLAVKLGLSVVLPGLGNAQKVTLAAQAYSQMVAPLVQALPRKRPTVGDWLKGRLQSNYVLLEPITSQRWQARSSQEQSQPLVVRQLRCNPATWFAHEGAVYSLSPDNVCALTSTDIQIGELVGFTCLAVTEPWTMEGIATGTAPRIDISGCRVFCDDRWSDSPNCGQYVDEAWLYHSFAIGAYDYCGSLLFRE